VRRECLDAVGLLDERFFIYDEDIDWCRRAWNLGWKVRFWPGVAMIHLGAAARPHMRDKTFVISGAGCPTSRSTIQDSRGPSITLRCRRAWPVRPPASWRGS